MGLDMKTNVGQADQVLRILIGALLLTMAATELISSWAWIAGFLILASGTAGFCGLYALLGLSTCKDELHSS
jgi:hypothetical protein